MDGIEYQQRRRDRSGVAAGFERCDMTQVENRLLVLRLPAEDDNYVFRIAELPASQAGEVERNLRSGKMIYREIEQTFGDAMDLAQAVRALPHENYTVIQPPAFGESQLAD